MGDVLDKVFPGEHDEHEGFLYQRYGWSAVMQYRRLQEDEECSAHSAVDVAVAAYMQQQRILAIAQAT